MFLARKAKFLSAVTSSSSPAGGIGIYSSCYPLGFWKNPAAQFSSTAVSVTAPTAWNTKIVCTLGPASNNDDTLKQLVLSGMDVCRLNFSHGTHEEHYETFQRVRRVGKLVGNEQVAVLVDIQGPKIRTGKMQQPFQVQKGDVIRVTSQELPNGGGTPDRIQIRYDTLYQDLDVDDVIYINDGTVKLVVTEKDDTTKNLICSVAMSGTISNNKGCNLPSGNLSVSVVTPKDQADLEFIAKELDPEYIAASFIGCGDDIQHIRNVLIEAGGDPDTKIIAKVERPIALQNIDDIIEQSDAVMVARGDLGVEIDAWDVPMWQKRIIERCNRESKPVIVATQMLDSMIQNARPTRAEASDVFNAVVDGADAVMLSGETSVGQWPVETVRVMDEILRVAQDHIPKHDPQQFHSKYGDSIAENVCMAVHAFADQFRENNQAGKVLVITESGFAARNIAKYRPALPILAFSPSLRTVRELAMVWGVRAYHMPDDDEYDKKSNDAETKAIRAVQKAVELDLIEPNDERVCVLAAAAQSTTGYFCGVFDVAKLKETNFAPP